MNYILPLTVLRNSLGDCTFGGISSKATQLYLVGIKEEGSKEVTYMENLLKEEKKLYIGYSSENCTHVILIKRKLFGQEADYIVPLDLYKSGKWYMAGGNFAYTSDSRFSEITGHRYPLPIFDRVED